MRIIAILFLLVLEGAAQASSVDGDFDRFYCDEKGSQEECVLYRASIINLIATPERFHGKKVRVAGYLLMGRESIALFLGKDASPTEAIWLSIHDGPLETRADADRFANKEKQIKSKFNNRRILVEGEFDMNAKVPLLFHGTIKNISRIQRW